MFLPGSAWYSGTEGASLCSILPESVLAQAVETVAQPSRAQCLEAGLESSLLVLGVAVQRPVHVFKPKLVFRYIQRLVSSRGLSARRTWLLGNQLIDLCCSIMLYQAPDSLSSELRGVLCYLMESSEDVDVQSRAKLLYAALYALSESKVGEAAAAAVLQRPGEGQGAGLQYPLCSAAPEAQQSVLRLASPVPGPELLKQLSERLAPWLVCREPRKGSLHAIFLAPQRRHILLAVDSLAGQLVASLVVESWQLLAPVQVFLEKLCSPKSRC
ncbi:hypothetical protein IscW_ISCW001790 [Ixodes scapularis]|uniref:Uncharacterized protein n=1 Tax=Ixodes scapularis TaxID=6945 RepID=B7P138_IXOSC|nr:hypothetical protein IscW_ISCW001790 [Ixodes scapularis]|eukprot:XP_002400157.1 hypothetical protein IscW_ISCW001790 [Ixodes scapularis]